LNEIQRILLIDPPSVSARLRGVYPAPLRLRGFGEQNRKIFLTPQHQKFFQNFGAGQVFLIACRQNFFNSPA